MPEGEEGEKWAENLFRDIINENFTNNGERFDYPKFRKFIGSPEISTQNDPLQDT